MPEGQETPKLLQDLSDQELIAHMKKAADRSKDKEMRVAYVGAMRIRRLSAQKEEMADLIVDLIISDADIRRRMSPESAEYVFARRRAKMAKMVISS